jgi:hypothetical protein
MTANTTPTRMRVGVVGIAYGNFKSPVLYSKKSTSA